MSIELCERCEKPYEAGKTTHYCPDCLKKIRGDYARSRNLNMIGAEARWGNTDRDKPKKVEYKMRFCKYCGQPLLDGQRTYCDVVCKNMDNYCPDRTPKTDGRRKRSPPDKFHDFAEAQKQAKKQGKHLSYGDWQSTKYIITSKKI